MVIFKGIVLKPLSLVISKWPEVLPSSGLGSVAGRLRLVGDFGPPLAVLLTIINGRVVTVLFVRYI